MKLFGGWRPLEEAYTSVGVVVSYLKESEMIGKGSLHFLSRKTLQL